MPAQQRPWRNQKHATRGTRQVPGRGRKQRPIARLELRPPNMAAQNLELVTQHQQLDVLDIQTAATPTRPQTQPHPAPRSSFTRRRTHAPTIAYIDRRIQEGKTDTKRTRCLKRYRARNLYRSLEHRPQLTA
jgi:hypothetical protein